MLKAYFNEKKIKKSRVIYRLKRLIVNNKYLKILLKNAIDNYNASIKKKTILGLKFKEGWIQRYLLLKKKSFKAFRKFLSLLKEKKTFKEEIQENYKYRLTKFTFHKWKVFRVKCIRRRKQIVFIT